MNNLDEVRVSFTDFWPGFDEEAFFFPLIRESTGMNPIRTGSRQSQVRFISVFNQIRFPSGRPLPGRPLKVWPRSATKKSQKSIWFTLENMRPPVGNFDLTISFDEDPYDGTNTTFPIVLMSLDWFGNTSAKLSKEAARSGVLLTPEEVASSRRSDVATRKKFACAFIGNPEPTRMRAVEMLRQVGEVDVFGKQGERIVKDKNSIAREYRFNLCFENDLYPNYITEKTVDAWGSGCIPIWSGLDSQNLLNKSSMVRYDPVAGLSEMIQEVQYLENNKGEMTKMGEAPLFNRVPEIGVLKKEVKRVFSEISGT